MVCFNYLWILGDCLKLLLKLQIIAMHLVCTGDGMRGLQSAEYKPKVLSYSSPRLQCYASVSCVLLEAHGLHMYLKAMYYLANNLHRIVEELDSSLCCHFFIQEDERKKEGMFLTFNLYPAVCLYHWACSWWLWWWGRRGCSG